ncbi:glyoxylase-like metal-dependent hydrolase (beta-lactamase superfamily II) [Chitinophaga dinghuensis]|uniref:Glyoxylase-like metal-dependent hydrolase (Beta-lactamase superfamily II) n=1 Tax=Chitinophaga dinghuensis TaxID=1539050 RepID=A0A327WCP4_9BACT|nr:MBL fold metallo-hydrolase [Chitinophaga dinghuensis]RAJ87918.1 glyoxylase-like metal-dependent hydrolase (beta-lactamase superfamily II) [Chitinophaga dinghuensis]
MHVEQIYTGCLAQGAYYISSAGEAAIIDPLRDTAPYLQRAAKDGVKIKYIFETHFHADFVSGHLDLHQQTGAPIVYGPAADPAFEAIIATDGQEFKIGDVTIQVLHTPGHTLESVTYLLKDETGKDYAIFSGDTLFLGDVGRPDLAQKKDHITKEDLAGMLYDSLNNKIMPLADDVIVYPAHGAGSACGKNMMKETVDTLGNQKKLNYALNQPDKASFVKAVTDGLLPPPDYFPANVLMNKQGYKSLDEVMERGLMGLTPEAFESAANETRALILDTRDNTAFTAGFVPRSVNIGLRGDFAPWVGALVGDVAQPLLLVSEPGTESEVIERLSRVGFDNVIGYLEGGFESWRDAGKTVDTIHRISADTFAEAFNEDTTVIDIRKQTEYDAEHVKDAYNRPLSDISAWVKEVGHKNQHFYIHCAGGYRSSIAASILQMHGYRNFSEIAGGMNAINKTTVPVTDFVCQSRTFKN